MNPKHPRCNADTVDKQACQHVCGLELGHGGKHECRLCEYVWKEVRPNGQPTGEGGRQRSTKCLSDSTNTTGKPIPAATGYSRQAWAQLEAAHLNHMGGFQHE